MAHRSLLLAVKSCLAPEVPSPKAFPTRLYEFCEANASRKNVRSMSRFGRLSCVSGMGNISQQKENGRNCLFSVLGHQGESKQPEAPERAPSPEGGRRRIGFLGFNGIRTL